MDCQALGRFERRHTDVVKHTVQLSDEMSKLWDKGDQLRATDQLRMERLQQLADKEKLSNAEMSEAEKLSNQLKNRYGNLGIAVDKAARDIESNGEKIDSRTWAAAVLSHFNRGKENQMNMHAL